MAATGDDRFELRFWGVRGSIACPGPGTVRYGGNTSCIELRCGPHLIILDAGTGLRSLGNALLDQAPVDADILLTHTHLDHISGLPFFRPAFRPGYCFRLHAGHLQPDFRLEDVLCQMMVEPLFPVPVDIFAAEMCFLDFRVGDRLDLKPGVVVQTAPLNHPNRATGYRIEYGGKALCYVTDTEHAPGRPDRNILGLIEGADLVVYDCTYTDEEFVAFQQWGHSTWQEGLRLCEAANARRLAIFHHDPDHDDAFMDRIAAEAEALRPGTIVAREGLTIAL